MGYFHRGLARCREVGGGLVPPKKALTVEGNVLDASQEASNPIPLHRKASVWPRIPRTKEEFRAKDAASVIGCDVSDIAGYGFRAPLDVDGDPILDKAVLTVVFTDGSKKAVEHPIA